LGTYSYIFTKIKIEVFLILMRGLDHMVTIPQIYYLG
jgi:hypothetical protein